MLADAAGVGLATLRLMVAIGVSFMPRANKRIGAVLITSFVAFLLGGCSQDRLSFENFRHIQTQASTTVDVVRLIGEPDDRLGNQWMFDRPAKHLHVFLDFDEGGHVTRKQWYDAINNIWEDSDETAASRFDLGSDSGTQ